MIHLIGIENVDLSRVLTIGASIGADGAVYGCHFYNSELVDAWERFRFLRAAT